MRNLLFLFLAALMVVATSCTSVDSKERGVKKKWGGEIDVTKIYEPGLHSGINWVWDEMITFDVSQQTLVEKYEFNDKNNMGTGVEVALDYSINPKTVGLYYTKVSDPDVKLQKTLKSSAKEVIPQYTASELNLTKRQEAEQKLAEILEKELPEFYIIFDRVQITDVDIPAGIAQAAEATAKQAELNKLAESKVIQAKNNLDAAKFDAESKAILSKPEMLALKKLEVEMEWAKKGVSPYGNNNVFGGETAIVKGLK